MYCYGSHKNSKEECKQCELATYCRGARDPALLCDGMASYSDEIEPPQLEELEALPPGDGAPATKLYTQSDLLEVVAFMLAMDTRTLELLDERIKHPGVTFRELAQERNISRQAVHKFLKKQCGKVPEIAALMRIGERKRKNPNNITFMEAVCKIRRKTHASRLNKPKSDSMCWKRSIFSNRSLNLSNMSILKGSAIWSRGCEA